MALREKAEPLAEAACLHNASEKVGFCPITACRQIVRERHRSWLSLGRQRHAGPGAPIPWDLLQRGKPLPLCVSEYRLNLSFLCCLELP
ncbi:MAG: hypothetical protein KatS3mg111_0924 [Pirellulaceae bacterium]|nr:MAG: hypothetical protein KatS3mg111_0924 [Pirellulaceae bacterium]